MSYQRDYQGPTREEMERALAEDRRPPAEKIAAFLRRYGSPVAAWRNWRGAENAKAGDLVRFALSDGQQITDPDEAKSLGLTVEAKKLRQRLAGTEDTEDAETIRGGGMRKLTDVTRWTCPTCKTWLELRNDMVWSTPTCTGDPDKPHREIGMKK